MLLLVVIPTAWSIALIALIALCVSAARGDAQGEPAEEELAPLPAYQLSRPAAASPSSHLRLVDARSA